jgi:hypothetical protein
MKFSALVRETASSPQPSPPEEEREKLRARGEHLAHGGSFPAWCYMA